MLRRMDGNLQAVLSYGNVRHASLELQKRGYESLIFGSEARLLNFARGGQGHLFVPAIRQRQRFGDVFIKGDDLFYIVAAPDQRFIDPGGADVFNSGWNVVGCLTPLEDRTFKSFIDFGRSLAEVLRIDPLMGFLPFSSTVETPRIDALRSTHVLTFKPPTFTDAEREASRVLRNDVHRDALRRLLRPQKNYTLQEASANALRVSALIDSAEPPAPTDLARTLTCKNHWMTIEVTGALYEAGFSERNVVWSVCDATSDNEIDIVAETGDNLWFLELQEGSFDSKHAVNLRHRADRYKATHVFAVCTELIQRAAFNALVSREQTLLPLFVEGLDKLAHAINAGISHGALEHVCKRIRPLEAILNAELGLLVRTRYRDDVPLPERPACLGPPGRGLRPSR